MYRKKKKKKKFDCKRTRTLFYLDFSSVATLNLSTMSTLLLELTVKTPYSGPSFIADISLKWTFFWGMDEMTIKHLSIVDIVFRSQLILPLERTSWHIQYKAFFARYVYLFYFGQCFTVLFKLSSIFVILLFS